MNKDNKNRMISIKIKLLGIILPVVIIVMMVLVGISYSISKNIIRKYSENLLSSSIENQSNEIVAWLNENLSAFQMAKGIIESTTSDKEEQQALINGCYGKNDNCMNGLYIADINGNMIVAEETQKSESNPCESVWFKDGLTRCNMGFTQAYTNSEGESVISASGILQDGSGTMKVISADLSLKRVSIITYSHFCIKSSKPN